MLSGAGDPGARDVARILLPGFFLLTFAFTWSAWLVSAALATPGNAWFFGLGGPVFLLGVFAPALGMERVCASAPRKASGARRRQCAARGHLGALASAALLSARQRKRRHAVPIEPSPQRDQITIAELQ